MLDPKVEAQLRQLHDNAVSGRYGKVMADAIAKAGPMPDGVPGMLAYLRDFVDPQQYDFEGIHQSAQYLLAPLLYLYARLKTRDPKLAEIFGNAFLTDYPGKPGTNLLTRWECLTEAIGAQKQASASPDRVILWQTSKGLLASTAEFINGLLGFLIVAWQVAHDTVPNETFITMTSYGTKLKTFENLTGGDKGVFYHWFRLVDHTLRNAIAHNSIRLDSDDDMVRYENGGKRYEMPLIEFMARTTLASQVPRAYMAFLNAMCVLEMGTLEQKLLLPEAILMTFVNVTVTCSPKTGPRIYCKAGYKTARGSSYADQQIQRRADHRHPQAA